MKRILGIFALLVVICVVTGAFEPAFFTATNLENIARGRPGAP